MKFFQMSNENDEAQYRREEREWELGPDTPEEGLKAHALLDWLRSNGDVEVRTPEQTERLNYLKERLEELQNSEEEVDEDVINEIENEIDSLEDAIDVYDIIPSGKHYYMTEFEVEALSGRRYAVGTSDETRNSAEDAAKSMVDDMGIDAFSPSFAKSHLDTDKIEDEARDYYDQDVYQNPDSYLNEDEDRDLSDRQIQEIAVYNKKIKQAKETIEYLETIEGTDSKIEELTEMIDEMESEIIDIEESPQGEFNQEKIEARIEELVSDVSYHPESFLNDFGLDWKDFVDMDALIEDAIDTDGEAHFINNYDGSSDEMEVEGRTFIVMRID